MTQEKRNKIVQLYLDGYSLPNLSAKVKVKETEIKEVLKMYHDLQGIFFFDEFEDWICPIHRE